MFKYLRGLVLSSFEDAACIFVGLVLLFGLSFMPVQSSLKNLVGDISQKFETLVAKANSQRDVISQLEEKMMEVKMEESFLNLFS